jgi:hypothetical protein
LLTISWQDDPAVTGKGGHMTDDPKYTRRGFMQKSSAIGGALGVGVVLGTEESAAALDRSARESHRAAIAAINEDAKTRPPLSPEQIIGLYLNNMGTIDLSRLPMALHTEEGLPTADKVGVAVTAGAAGVVGTMVGKGIGDALERKRESLPQDEAHAARVTGERKDKGPPQVGG